SQIDDCLDLAKQINLDGIVATNTTVERTKLKTSENKLEIIGAGGLSGSPLREKSTEIVRHIRSQLGDAFGIVGSGGIFTAEEAAEKLSAGAMLVQVWTGFIYEGPAITRRILRHLLAYKSQN